MRAGADCADDFFWLGGGENEDQVLWGLLHNLQQGVEALGGDHVGFVDNEDAVAGFRRGVCGAIAQVTHIVHAVVAGGIQLHHVQVARPPGCQRHTRVTHPTGGGRWPLHAVEGPGQNTSRRCFTAPPRASK